MALKKELVFANGVKIEYHMIDDVQIDNKSKIVKLKVVSYTDKTYRDSEVLNKTSQEKYEELLNLIMEENKKEEQDRNTEQVIIWSDEANTLKFNQELDLKVVTTDIELKDVTDFNMSNLYDLLKQDGMFIDSTDI